MALLAVVFVSEFALGQLPEVTNDPSFHFKIAAEAIKHGDFAVAERELKRSLELAPDNALLFYNLAIVQERLDRPQEALASIERALKIGLGDSERSSATDLYARITYALEKRAREPLFAVLPFSDVEVPKALLTVDDLRPRLGELATILFSKTLPTSRLSIVDHSSLDSNLAIPCPHEYVVADAIVRHGGRFPETIEKRAQRRSTCIGGWLRGHAGDYSSFAVSSGTVAFVVMDCTYMKTYAHYGLGTGDFPETTYLVLSFHAVMADGEYRTSKSRTVAVPALNMKTFQAQYPDVAVMLTQVVTTAQDLLGELHLLSAK